MTREDYRRLLHEGDRVRVRYLDDAAEATGAADPAYAADTCGRAAWEGTLEFKTPEGSYVRGPDGLSEYVLWYDLEPAGGWAPEEPDRE